LYSVFSFVDSSPQYNKYCLMLREMRQDIKKTRGTESKIS
jgi:hypothetical protein